MSANARITGIATGVTVQAKAVDGVWWDLVEGDLIEDREEIRVEADTAKYSFAAYTLQRKASGVWVDAVTVSLDVTSGCSHFRQDRWEITGDDTNSTCALRVTVAQGQELFRMMLLGLQAAETGIGGGRFTWPDRAGANFPTPAKYRGVANNLDYTNKLEEGGFGIEQTTRVVCDKAQFANGSADFRPGQRILWQSGALLRIRAVEEDEVSYTLEVVKSASQ